MRISGAYPLKIQQINTFSPSRSDRVSFEENKLDKKAESFRR